MGAHAGSLTGGPTLGFVADAAGLVLVVVVVGLVVRFAVELIAGLLGEGEA